MILEIKSETIICVDIYICLSINLLRNKVLLMQHFIYNSFPIYIIKF